MKNKNRLAREAVNIRHVPLFDGEPKEFWREQEEERQAALDKRVMDSIQKSYPQGNPKDMVGRRKVPLSLIPSSALVHEAMAFKYGAFEAPCVDGKKGYGPYNWRTAPVSASVYIDAMLRHILDYLDGEEVADDSGAHHLGHARACAGIILDAMENKTLIDDRPTKGKASEILKRMVKK